MMCLMERGMVWWERVPQRAHAEATPTSPRYQLDDWSTIE